MLAAFGTWCARNPVALALSAAVAGLFVYFFGFHQVYTSGTHSAWRWMIGSWGFENNQEHSWLVPPLFFFLLWYHREELRKAQITPSNAGLLIIIAGVALFVVATRSIQGRLAIVAMATLIYGAVRFLWGREVGRVFIFPCLFLLFMMPLGGLVQGTVTLQLLVSSSVQALSSLIGVKIEMIGTTLKAMDGSFNFEIAEGCSGIRSLMAMTMLSALYVHFTQDKLWKQLVIFGGSLLFALVGNIGRIFTVILFAKFISPRIAGGIYHDYSGFIFFPVAVAAMVSFSGLLNADWGGMVSRWLKPERQLAKVNTPESSAAAKPANPISYDY